MITLEPLPMQEAIEFFRRKGLVITERWEDLSAEAQAKSFTVAGITRMDVLADIHTEIKKALEEGMDINEFKKNFKDIMRRRGWYDEKFEKPWRIETIFRTNIQNAYQAGRYKRQKELMFLRPYWMYDAVNDARTRPTHLAMDRKIFRADDPIWDVWYPPNGFNCRCSVIALSESQMRRHGYKVEENPPEVMPDAGFEHNPGEVVFGAEIKKKLERYKKVFNKAFFSRIEKEIDNIVHNIMTTTFDKLKREYKVATQAPITIKNDLLKEENNVAGQARYETGEIGIHKDRYGKVIEVLKKGSIDTEEEARAFHTLVHEFGHLIGFKINYFLYSNFKDYRYYSQVINDLWAHFSEHNIAKRLGIKINIQVNPMFLGYGEYTRRFLKVLKSTGFSDDEIKNLVIRLNTKVDPEDYVSEIAKEIIIKTKKEFSASQEATLYWSLQRSILEEKNCDGLIRWLKKL